MKIKHGTDVLVVWAPLWEGRMALLQPADYHCCLMMVETVLEFGSPRQKCRRKINYRVHFGRQKDRSRWSLPFGFATRSPEYCYHCKLSHATCYTAQFAALFYTHVHVYIVKQYNYKPHICHTRVIINCYMYMFVLCRLERGGGSFNL